MKISHKLMVVKWRDSRHLRREFFLPKDIKDASLAIIETVGFGFVLEDKVVLSMEYYPEDKSQDPQYREVIAIPKECVVEIRYLRERKKEEDVK